MHRIIRWASHVTSRGNQREDIYLSDADRVAWLNLLGQVCERFNWRCHAYCQMTNHYHLVRETPEGNLAQGMRQLNGGYSQYIKTVPTKTSDMYFRGDINPSWWKKTATCLNWLDTWHSTRYVQAWSMKSPLGRSSYPAMIGAVTTPGWLQTDWLLAQFDPQPKLARAKGMDFVRAGAGLPSVWDSLRNQIFLGSETFVAELQAGISPNQLLESRACSDGSLLNRWTVT